MKSFFTLIFTWITFSFVIGQSAITLNSSNVPIPEGAYTFSEITTNNPPSPTIGNNQLWNYATYNNLDTFDSFFFKEEDPFYTSEGIDVYQPGFKLLNQNLGYNLYLEIDFNENGVEDKGIYIDQQTYTLQHLTGNAADNITFPLQGYILNNPRKIMKFPMTNGTSWESTSNYSTNFTIKVAAFGLNNVPARHAYSTVRKDTIIGWGKMSVYTPNGPSISYDVLMNRSVQYSVDSFYLNGAPAPAALLNAFSVTQGQISGLTHTYNFYRAGTYSYLTRFFYGTDATFTNLNAAFVTLEDLTPATSSTQEFSNESYATVIFPNPSNGQEINLLLIGKDMDQVNYQITDLAGRMIQSKDNYKLDNNTMTLDLGNNSSTGMYMLLVKDSNNKVIATEKITIQR